MCIRDRYSKEMAKEALDKHLYPALETFVYEEEYQDIRSTLVKDSTVVREDAMKKMEELINIFEQSKQEFDNKTLKSDGEAKTFNVDGESLLYAFEAKVGKSESLRHLAVFFKKSNSPAAERFRGAFLTRLSELLLSTAKRILKAELHFNQRGPVITADGSQPWTEAGTDLYMEEVDNQLRGIVREEYEKYVLPHVLHQFALGTLFELEKMYSNLSGIISSFGIDQKVLINQEGPNFDKWSKTLEKQGISVKSVAELEGLTRFLNDASRSSAILYIENKDASKSADALALSLAERLAEEKQGVIKKDDKTSFLNFVVRFYHETMAFERRFEHGRKTQQYLENDIPKLIELNKIRDEPRFLISSHENLLLKLDAICKKALYGKDYAFPVEFNEQDSSLPKYFQYDIRRPVSEWFDETLDTLITSFFEVRHQIATRFPRRRELVAIDTELEALLTPANVHSMLKEHLEKEVTILKFYRDASTAGQYGEMNDEIHEFKRRRRLDAVSRAPPALLHQFTASVFATEERFLREMDKEEEFEPLEDFPTFERLHNRLYDPKASLVRPLFDLYTEPRPLSKVNFKPPPASFSVVDLTDEISIALRQILNEEVRKEKGSMIQKELSIFFDKVEKELARSRGKMT
eukprot:TRINITY_DN760_c0_g1_i1.p1 TRINITY_DN760_c0_g1~~TRINITY_DN760_c0_g1_i1.p1  ORF type:complete len:652 (+),score=215.30 TRINITY_DN760_c0_g1_i1:49-1956(+)